MSENKCIAIILGVICCVLLVIVALALGLGLGLGLGLKPNNTTESMDFNTTQNVSFSVTVV